MNIRCLRFIICICGIAFTSTAIAKESPIAVCENTFDYAASHMSTPDLYDFWDSFKSDQQRKEYLNSFAASNNYGEKAALIRLFYHPTFQYNYPEIFNQRRCIIDIIKDLKGKTQYSFGDYLLLNQLCHLEPDLLQSDLLSLARGIDKTPVIWDVNTSNLIGQTFIYTENDYTTLFLAEFFGFDWFEDTQLPSWLGELYCISALGNSISDDIILGEINKLDELFNLHKKNLDRWKKARANLLGQENEAVWTDRCNVSEGISQILLSLRYCGKRSAKALPLLYSILDYQFSQKDSLLQDYETSLAIISINPDDQKAIARLFPFCSDGDKYQKLSEFEYPSAIIHSYDAKYQGELLNNKLFCRTLEQLRTDNKLSFSNYLRIYGVPTLTLEQYRKIRQELFEYSKNNPEDVSSSAVAEFLLSQRQKHAEVKSDVTKLLDFYWNNIVSVPDNDIKTKTIPSSESEYPDLVRMDFLIYVCLSIFTSEETVDYVVNNLSKKNASLLINRFEIQIQSGECPYDGLPIAFNKKRTLELFRNKFQEYPENGSELILFKDFLKSFEGHDLRQ